METVLLFLINSAKLLPRAPCCLWCGRMTVSSVVILIVNIYLETYLFQYIIFMLFLKPALYQYSVAAITNYHELIDFKNPPQIYHLIVLEARSLKWVSVGYNHVLSQGSKGESLFFLFQLPEGAYFLGQLASPCIFKASGT